LFLEQRPAIQSVFWMHLEARDTGHEPRSVEDAFTVVVPQHMADVLAEEALDAFAEFGDTVNVNLLHAPRLAAGEVLLARRERWDLLVDLVVPTDVGDKVFDEGKGLHGPDGYPLAIFSNWRLAQKSRKAVDLSRARAALCGFAVPSHRQIRRQVRLNPENGIQDDHALSNRDAIRNQLTSARVAEIGRAHV